MATNLLLEGDDLEALLIRAHSQGGPGARIVRADKYRHGGVWGFFARERFEVAVEVPPAAPAEPGAAFRLPGEAGRTTLPEGHGEARPTGRRALRPSAQVPLPPPARPVADAYAMPEPGALVADGLLGIADRVSAAERAAAHAVEALIVQRRTDELAATPRISAGRAAHRGVEQLVPAQRIPPQEIQIPEQVFAQQVSVSAAAGHRSPAATLPAPSMNGPVTLAMSTPTRPTRADSERATSTIPAVPTAGPIGGSGAGPSDISSDISSDVPDDRSSEGPAAPDAETLAELAALEALANGLVSRVTHEPATSPVRPSTSRPEFTALLDQLRDGVRPPRQRTATSGEQQPSVPVPAQPIPTSEQAVSHDPVEPAGSHETVERAVDVPTATTATTTAPGTPVDDPGTAAARQTLRALGVPAAWTRLLRPGDRFAEVLRMLERMPDPDIDPETPVIAVVGPAHAVRLEAHRIAIDLAADDLPRPVVEIPAAAGADRTTAIARALGAGPVVLAVETEDDDPTPLRDVLSRVRAGAVIAVVDAAVPLERTQRWVDALGRVDALVVDGATSVPDPATVLQLGLPVVRMDGVPLDRVTWTALLCAQLLAEESTTAPAPRR